MKSKETGKILKKFIIVKNIIFTTILAILVIIISFIVIARLSGGTPAIFGYEMFRVSSESMTPELNVGDIILTHSVGIDEMKVGDIVTYDGKDGDLAGKMITHRIIAQPYKENGDIYIRTKGDANEASDAPVNIKNVHGIMITRIDFLRFIYSFFVTPWGLLTIILLIVLAFFNEIIIFVRAITGHTFEEKKEKTVEEIIAEYVEDNKRQRQLEVEVEAELIEREQRGRTSDSETDNNIQ